MFITNELETASKQHIKDIYYSVIPMHTIPVAGNRESCLCLVFLTIHESRSIQFSDTPMPDGYFHIFVPNKVTKIFPKYLYQN